MFQFMLTLAFLASVWSGIGVWRNGRRTQKREVSFAEQFASRETVERIEFSLGESMKKDSANRREIYDRLRNDTEVLHEKINGVDRKVGGLETATELLSQRMIQMDQKLDRAIERRSE